ncbi:hypothetical protein ACUL41_07025 [Virgibacillus natechei]
MLEKNFSDSDFIMAYNKFSEVEGRFHLTPNEFYLYCTLFIDKRVDRTITTAPCIIEELLRVPFKKDVHDNKKVIIETLTSLIDKEVFILENDVDVTEMKNTTVVQMSINDIELSGNYSEEQDWQRFRKIPYTTFSKFTNINNLYIFYVVERQIDGFKSAFTHWGKVLHCSTRTARRWVEKAIKDGVLHRNSGDFQEDLKTQNINWYYTHEIEEKDKTLRTRMNEKEKEQKQRESEIKHGFGQTIDEHRNTKKNKISVKIGNNEEEIPF